MKNNRADGSKSRSNPAKNQTKKARKSFFIPPNKEDGEKKNEQAKNEIMDFTL